MNIVTQRVIFIGVNGSKEKNTDKATISGLTEINTRVLMSMGREKATVNIAMQMELFTKGNGKMGKNMETAYSRTVMEILT